MYDIQLRKSGKLFVKVWSAKDEDYKEREVSYGDLSIHLHDYVCFDKDIRLKDVFLLFRRDVSLFAGAVGCPFLEDLVEEAMLPAAPGKEKGLAAFVVSWLAYKEMGGEFNENPHVFTCPVMSGVGLDTDFDLSMVHINQVSTMPIVLDTSFEIVDPNIEKVIFHGNKIFTLLDISKAVLDELGSNPPEIREYISNEHLLDTPVPDVAAKLEEHILQAAQGKACKLCGNNTKSYHFNKPDDICGRCFEKEREN